MQVYRSNKSENTRLEEFLFQECVWIKWNEMKSNCGCWNGGLGLFGCEKMELFCLVDLIALATTRLFCRFYELIQLVILLHIILVGLVLIQPSFLMIQNYEKVRSEPEKKLDPENHNLTEDSTRVSQRSRSTISHGLKIQVINGKNAYDTRTRLSLL